MNNNIILHGLDPRLDEILADTYYQLIYQEQVTAIATKLAGWSEGEADGIRKTIGRKIQKELDILIPRLIKDFISHGMKEESAKQLASAIQACGSYNFNKAHSVEYGLIAYQTAYLKANYPVEYMCSLLNANIDTTEDVIPYINECKRMGIKILPPDVSIGNLKFKPENGAIRIGLSYIKGISNITVDYTSKGSLKNFFCRNHYNKRVKEALIKAGALDCFNYTRAEQFAIAMDIDEEVLSEQNKIDMANIKILAKEQEIAKSKQGTKKVAILKNQIENQHKAIAKSETRIKQLKDSVNADYDEAQGEIEVLGFTFHDKFEKYDVDNYQIYNKELSIQQKILADVISIRKIKDKRGRDMAFITAVPYMEVKTDFVMFASNYQELKEGIYAFIVEGNKIIKVGYGIKK